MLQRKRQHGPPAMIALALTALFAAVAANAALVPFVADRLSPKSSAPVSAGVGLVAGNENLPAVTKLAA
jgi:hypothetical protein